MNNKVEKVAIITGASRCNAETISKRFFVC